MNFAIAATLDDALSALGAGARPIAGGTDMVVGARQGKKPLPESVIAIDRLAELSTIEETGDGLRIGAAVSHATLMADPRVVADYTAIADAAALVGSPATRNAGTLGGNIMNASPAMDTGAPLLVLGATAELRSVSGHRSVSMNDLWTGVGETSTRPDELCVAVSLPGRPPRSSSAYIRLEYRRAMEIAIVGAAGAVTLNDDDTAADAVVALTAVAPTIVSVVGVAEALVGRPVDEDALTAVASMAAEQASPISDIRAGENYRRQMVGVMARRAVEAAAHRAQGEAISVPLNRASGVGAAR